MAKHIICNHDDRYFWFEYRTGDRASFNGQSQFETIEEFEEHYKAHTGPLFSMKDYLHSMEMKNCFAKFQDLSDAEMVNPMKELAERMPKESFIDMARIAEHHHQYGAGMQALMGVPKELTGVYNKKGQAKPDVEIGVTKRGGWVPFLRVENQTFYIQYESSDKKEVEWMADNLRTAINKLL